MKFWSETVFGYLINFGKLLCLLPLDSGSSFTLKVLNRVGCFIVFINVIGMELSLLSTIYINFHDKILVTTLLSIVMLFLELLLNLLIWQFKKAKLQKLLQEFKNFLSASKEHERVIINLYFNHYKYFYTLFFIFASGTAIIRVIFAPMRQSPKIPHATYYPFPIEQPSVIYYMVYLSQSIASFYCGIQTIFIIITAMMLTYAAIKMKILVYDFKRVENCSQLKLWIYQHLECIRFVNYINEVLGFVILKSYIFLGLTIIFGTMKFIYNPDLYTIARTPLTILSCLIGTYIYNGPADDIYEMNHAIGHMLYDMEWNNELMKMKKDIIIVMIRIQKPIFICPLKGLMPALNRKIYTNFLSYLISYIMTLRAIVNTQ
ncbi:odorant receptor 67a-like isoform X1 [Chelonus insularis]|uniref:odorant receptor 67a-like isoform X1 n=1 Tax=Chelonus insularis TaxID=460826 RepID=UPI00158DFF3A|nr:odorant receptor 67a-like isoform X1 [Chelonus insularis]